MRTLGVLIGLLAAAGGAAHAWVTITGDEGNRPIIAGRDDLFAAMFLGGASYVCVRNLEITHDAAVWAPALYFRGGIDIAGSPSSHILLQKLYIHHIDEGIVIDDDSLPGAQFTIENVTVHDNPSRHAYPMYVQYGLSNPISLTIRNTVIANGYGLVYIGPTVSFTCENNLFYRPGDSEQVEANGRTYTIAQLSQLGGGNIYGAPLFILPAWGTTGDYHMLAGSPGIDVGTSTGAPPFALDYTIRPQGAGYDMGAYER